MQENRYNTCDRFLGGLEKDFIITEQIEDSPLTSEPSFLDYGIIAVCNRGSAIIHLLDNKHVWNKNELIFLFPRQLCSMRNVSEDFSAKFIIIPHVLHGDVLSSLRHFDPGFHFFVKDHFYYNIYEDIQDDDKKSILRREYISFVLQDNSLFEQYDVLGNMQLYAAFHNKRYSEEKYRQILKSVNLDIPLHQSIQTLSGGQKQRVASARAIITNPQLVLADEPTGALDSKSAKQLLESFEALNQKLNATILMVTHDSFTASYANRILFIKDGKIFNELTKGNDTRKQFFEKIIEVQTLLGGELEDVI